MTIFARNTAGSCYQFDQIFLNVLDKHAPFKSKLVRANLSSYISGLLRKAIIRRSYLEFIAKQIGKKRSNRPEVSLGKGVLKICSKFTGERPCRSVILIKLLRYGCSPVNLLHIFRTPFPKNTSGWLLLKKALKHITKRKTFAADCIKKNGNGFSTILIRLLLLTINYSGKWRNHGIILFKVNYGWQIKLVEIDEVLQEDGLIAKELNEFFKNDMSNIKENSFITNMKSDDITDPIDKASDKYKFHASILLI